MRRGRNATPRNLGRAEQAVMDYVWAHAPVSAGAVRQGIRDSWPMKESTVRTVLLRLEQKGYLTHTVQGRAYIYRAAAQPITVAARAVRHIIDRFCGGSAEELVLGMVDHKVVSPTQLKRLLARIEAAAGRK